jgi:hypothetical protein
MYWAGSVGVVGSWFFISATSSVRKSLAVIVDAPVAAAVEDPVLGVVLAVVLATAALGLVKLLATPNPDFTACCDPLTIC